MHLASLGTLRDCLPGTRVSRLVAAAVMVRILSLLPPFSVAAVGLLVVGFWTCRRHVLVMRRRKGSDPSSPIERRR
jgi:hypothetical protein